MERMLKISATLAIVAGVIMIVVSVFGINFTYKNIARENITTTPDSAIPNQPVRGPFTLKAQADIIRVHSLKASGGKTFAEMPNTIPQLDAKGAPVLDKDGKPLMVPNLARNTWVTATTLTTALNLGILAYAFSALALFMGFVSVWTGVTFCALGKQYKKSEKENIA